MKNHLSWFSLNRKRNVANLIVFAILTLTAGCGNRPPEKKTTQALAVYPLRIVVLQDRTGSVDTTRTPRITIDQLDSLIETLKSRSGELSFGFLDDDSNESLHRLRLVPAPVGPVEPSKDGNPFKVSEELAKFRKAKKTYEEQSRFWEEDTARRIEAFRDAVRPLLEDQRRYGRTDINGGLLRADLFLAESSRAQGPQTSVVILITDGLDNVNRVPERMKSSPTMLVVNGSHSLGVLAKYQPETFESVEAALRFAADLKPENAAVINPAVREVTD